MEPDVVERFTREARAAVRIRNEHVARVMDVGNLDTGAPFIVMEYLEGQDLSSVVSSQGALPVTDAVDYILQACEALAVAHSLGIVHRDLKPANLFVVESHNARSLKVLDFGISKNMALTSASGPDAGMTQSAFMLGSPSYMSPEQMNSAKNVDGLTDIWALGVTLYELLTGVAPFQAESLPLLCMAILQQHPESLRSRLASVPEELDRVVLRCLEKDKTRRYQSIGELAAALEPFAPARSRLSLERISGLAAKPPPVPNSLPAGGVASAASVGSSASRRTAFDPRMPTVALDEPPEFPGLGAPNAGGAPAAAERTASGNTAWQHTAAEGRPASRRTSLLIAAFAGAALLVGAVVAYSLSGSSTPDVQTPSSASTMASAPLAIPVTQPAPNEPEPKAPAATSATPPRPLAQSPELAKPKSVTAPMTRPPRQNLPRKPAPPPRSTANWEDER
jgi:serine/threonine-protein kinase